MRMGDGGCPSILGTNSIAPTMSMALTCPLTRSACSLPVSLPPGTPSIGWPHRRSGTSGRSGSPNLVSSRGAGQFHMRQNYQEIIQRESNKEVQVKRSMHLLLLVLGVWLTGCTPYQATLTNEERPYPATVPEKVQIFLQGETTPTATEIGHIVVAEKSEMKGIELLQKKAAEMGADGVVNVEIK